MRPLIAAEPMLRAPRPEIVSESTLTEGVCAEAELVSAKMKANDKSVRDLLFIDFSSSENLCFKMELRLHRHDESLIVDRHIRLNLVVSDLLLELTSFGAHFDRVRHVPAGNFFVIAEHRFE